jgi:outer membrane protein assembly factor BamC
MKTQLNQLFLMGISIALMSSCAFVERFNGGDDYAQAGSQGDLYIPPELVTPEWNDSLKIPQTGSDRVSALDTYGKALDASVVPEFVDMTIRREGDLRWIEAEVDPVNVWPLLRSFWASQDVILDRDKPSIGVMETEWIEDIDSSSSEFTDVTEFTATRSKFKVRIEREPNAVSNIYVSQRKTQLQSITEQGAVWLDVNSDSETEAEMLVSLMQHLGESRDTAINAVTSAEGPRLYIELRDLNGMPILYVGDQYSRVWRRTGIALDRTGLEIYDQDRTKGIYHVRIEASDMSENSEIEAGDYQIHLLSQGAQTLLTAHSVEDDVTPLSSQAARVLLNQIVRAYEVFRTTG